MSDQGAGRAIGLDWIGLEWNGLDSLYGVQHTPTVSECTAIRMHWRLLP